MKKRTIVDLILIFALLIVLIFLGKKDYQVDKDKDKKRFDNEYSMVSKDNVFKYVTDEEVNDIIKKGDGIIFMAFKENEWSNYYAKFLNDVAKEWGIKEIYYYDFKMDREKQSVEYKKIVEYLKDFLKQDDIGNINLQAPCLLILKNKSVLAYDDGIQFMNSTITPQDYWKTENIDNKKEQFRIMISAYLGGNYGGEE